MKERFERRLGFILGFLIGDALGIPFAGLSQSEIDNHFKKNSIGFFKNQTNPMTYYLEPGQYSSNGLLFFYSLETLFLYGKDGSIFHEHLFKKMKLLAEKATESHFAGRWLGPSIFKAVLLGKKAKNNSATSIYRILPIIIVSKSRQKLFETALIETKSTHLSLMNHAATIFLCDLFFTILNERNSLESCILKALETTDNYFTDRGWQILREKIVMSLRTKMSINEARKYFGTGSIISEFLPLAIFIATHFPNLDEALYLASHSGRQEAREENETMYIYKQLNLLGGCTDVLCALVGAFAGSFYGHSIFEDKLIKELEKSEDIIDIVRKILSPGLFSSMFFNQSPNKS